MKVRIESLSDLVFGLALSIGAIALISNTPADIGALLLGLFWFTFSFLIIISVWFSYSHIISIIRIETGPMLRLNVALLLLVSIEPYLLNVMALDVNVKSNLSLLDYSSSLYALDLGFIFLIMAGFYQLALLQGKEVESFSGDRNSRLVDASFFLISSLPLFWTFSVFGLPLRFFIWYLTIPVGFITDRFLFKRSI